MSGFRTRPPNEIARILNTTLIPLGQVTNRMNEIDATRVTIVLCMMGA